MINGIEFSSVFKIEEKPILRPCLSESKREELQRFKAKALEIERRLAAKSKCSSIDYSTHSHTNIEEDENTESPGNVHKFADDIESCSGQSENHTDLDVDNENFVTSISEWDISSIPGFDHHDNGTASLCSAATATTDTIVDQPSETVSECAAGQSNDNTFVPTTMPPAALIRSDSFIVDEPSECFLKQLECSGFVLPSNSSNSFTDVTASMRTESNRTKVFFKPVEKRKPEVKKNSNPKTKKYAPKPFPTKKARIASDNISNLPEKLIRKCQSNSATARGTFDVRRDGQQLLKTVSKPQVPVASQPAMSSMESSFTQTDSNNHHECGNDTSSVDDRVAEIVRNIEAKFHSEIVLFLEKQRREQESFLRKLLAQVKVKQDSFQSNLVTQIKTLIGDGVSTLLRNQDNLSVLQDTANLMLNDVNGNLSLLGAEDKDCSQTERVRAATKINAFVRGYLTRRLFKTEHVQEVIKTIRDSLYLVIDLHFENNDNESVADIQMKHNLLQQLESNRYNLSHIFVSKTPAEQMAMISFDRQIMLHRLAQNNSKSKAPSNLMRPTSVEDKLKTLKVIEL